MGLFDFLKKKTTPTDGVEQAESVPDVSNKAKIPEAGHKIAPSVPEKEKKYYLPDDYYTYVIHEGTAFERRVVTFEERKKTCIPSERGLYVAEILLLFYCSKGKYPHPKDGYPGFWWFKYGIRDVGKALESLEDRGFIEFGTAADAAASLKVVELKELLSDAGLPKTGKKADLVKRVAENIPEEKILAAGAEQKYHLTKLGEEELEDNAYVPYMHNNRNTTVEGINGAYAEFNVWSINRILGRGDKSNWRAVVDDEERKSIEEAHRRYMKNLFDEEDGELIDDSEIKAQEVQLAKVQHAAKQYEKDGDLDSYIAFWEDIWKEGGPKFEGKMWMFTLPDLYIKAGRYEDALALVMKIKETRGAYYWDKADYYVKKIEGLIEKSARNR
ncbi:SAP domain-containing protein [Eubacterium sp. F2]|uniref:SAP domain-containing protein n=1 Tax=Eubacterium sp. F2 TaxID=3381348 RepID=UPI0039082AE4